MSRYGRSISVADYDVYRENDITLALDGELPLKIRAIAAETDTSVSALFTECLERIVTDRVAYPCARRRALTRLRKGLDLPWTPPNSRDELH